MKRDMDLMRDLLIAIEDGDEGTDHWIDVDSCCDDERKLHSHMRLLDEAGLIEGNRREAIGISHQFLPRRLTWSGHDFLDSVRDPEIWQKTKAGAESAGGFTLEILSDLAKGLIKTKIRQHTGVEI